MTDPHRVIEPYPRFAANAGHIRANDFGDLHRKRADTTGRAINQNLPRLNLPFVTNPRAR